jgi:hypothetical protein
VQAQWAQAELAQTGSVQGSWWGVGQRELSWCRHSGRRLSWRGLDQFGLSFCKLGRRGLRLVQAQWLQAELVQEQPWVSRGLCLCFWSQPSGPVCRHHVQSLRYWYPPCLLSHLRCHQRLDHRPTVDVRASCSRLCWHLSLEGARGCYGDQHVLGGRSGLCGSECAKCPSVIPSLQRSQHICVGRFKPNRTHHPSLVGQGCRHLQLSDRNTAHRHCQTSNSVDSSRGEAGVGSRVS